MGDAQLLSFGCGRLSFAMSPSMNLKATFSRRRARGRHRRTGAKSLTMSPMLGGWTALCPSPGCHPRSGFAVGDDRKWMDEGRHCPTMLVPCMIDAMFAILVSLLRTLRAAFRTRTDLALENLALHQQLATLHRCTPRVRLRPADRAFWMGLSRIWSRWSDALVIVKPDTVVRWHRAGSCQRE